MALWEGILIGMSCFTLGAVLTIVAFNFAMESSKRTVLTKFDGIKRMTLEQMAQFLFNVQASGSIINSVYPKSVKEWEDYLIGRN